MVNLSANVGDQIQVTFMRADNGVQTVQRINSRRMFLDSRSTQSRPGDTCVVKIVGQNPRGNVYFVKVVSVVRLGDGISSLLEKVVDAVARRGLGLHQFDPHGTARGIELARAHFDGDKVGLIDFLTDFVEYFRYYEGSRERLISYLRVGRTVADLIEEAFPNDYKAAVQAYVRIGSLLVSERLDELVARCLNSALASSRQAGDEALQLSVLEKIESVFHADPAFPRHLDYASALAGLIELFEKNGSVNCRRRLQAAQLRLDAKDAPGARAMLAPIVAHIETSNVFYSSAARATAASYQLENNDSEYLKWQLQAGISSYDEHKGIADVYFRLGRFQEAAEQYCQAFDLLKVDHGSTDPW